MPCNAKKDVFIISGYSTFADNASRNTEKKIMLTDSVGKLLYMNSIDKRMDSGEVKSTL